MNIDVFCSNVEKLLEYIDKLEKINKDNIETINNLRNVIKLKNLELDRSLKLNLEYERKKKQYKIIKEKLLFLLENIEDMSNKFFYEK